MTLQLQTRATSKHCSAWVAALLFIVLASGNQLDAFFVAQEAAHDVTGDWSAHLETPGGKLNFGISVEKTDNDDYVGFLVNGTERIKVPAVAFDGETLKLDIAHYDSKLALQIVDNRTLRGTWTKVRGKDNVPTLKCGAVRPPAPPHSAQHATPAADSAQTNFSGRWEVRFSSGGDLAVGVFSVDDNGKASGTFLTTTGDYRYLAGHAPTEDTLQLSCFDGAHAFLFRAKPVGTNSLSGDFWSGDHWHETWTAKRNANAALADSFRQTKVIAPSALNALTFPDLDGVPTRLGDPKFAAPVRIYHIFGSWCPNCHDAAVFLAELEKKYADKVSVVGLAFELTGDFKRDAKQVRAYLKRNSLNHTVLVAGVSDKKIASRAIPALDKVRSYPTSLFVDADGNVVAVHTGFSGPATGKAHTEIKQKYFGVIDSMLAGQSQPNANPAADK